MTVYDSRRALRVNSDLCAACELHFQQRGEIAGVGKAQPGVPRIIHEKSVDELRRMGENAGNGLDNLDRRYKLAVCNLEGDIDL